MRPRPPLWQRVRDVFWDTSPTPKSLKREHYSGALQGRLTSMWGTRPMSADREIENDITILRARTRDLCRNNAYARRYLWMARSHIVGPKGIQCYPRNKFGVDDRPKENLNFTIADAWTDWGRAANCSANRRLSWLQIQWLAASEWVSSGEFLCLKILDKKSPYGLRLMPIDIDRLDDTFHQKRDLGKNENEIRFGVEVNTLGEPVAYHILNRHPSDIGSAVERSRYREKIPASQVIHHYLHDERVERARGVSPLVVSMRDLRHLDGFQDAALVQARTAAAAMGFIVTKSPDGDTTTPEEGLEFSAEAGQIRELGMGQEFQEWNPNQPSDTYATFTKAVLRGIAAGLGVSYAMLANDLSDANYSSMRVGRNEEQEGWQSLQQWFIESLCQRVYDAWLENAVLFGGLVLPGNDVDKYRAVEWVPRRWVSVDPVKDIESDERRVALGVESRQDIAARDGNDLWVKMEKIQQEEEYATELGISIQPQKAGTNASEQGKGNPPVADADAPDGSGDGSGDASGEAGRSAHPAVALVRSAG